MKFKECFKLVDSFVSDSVNLRKEPNSELSESLEEERKCKFPKEFKDYIDNIAGNEPTYFEGVGNPIELLPRTELSWNMIGYNYHPVRKEAIPGWNDDWFLFANEGGDPIIIDLSENEDSCKVYKAMHGAGAWEFNVIASSIAEFIFYASALHHAMSGFDVDDPISDDESGFNLVEEPANWLFPIIEKHAPNYYEEWVSVFENS